MIKEQKYSPENWKKEIEDHLWHCYICKTCKLIRWHPLGYCHSCGSKLQRMVGTTSNLQDELHSLGYKESGI